MKKILSHIAVMAALLLSATACMEKIFPEGTEPTTPASIGNINITISDVTDNSFQVTIAPEGEPLFYSYLVASGKPETLDATKLYQGKYSDIAQGVVEFKTKSSVTLTIETEPNTDYTVYAVNSSNEGNVGEVVTKEVKTTDGVNPALLDFDNEGNVFYMEFAENVEYVEGSDIEATIYASAVSSYLDKSQAMGKKKASSVTVDGNVAAITFPDLPTGCYYTVDVPEGAFVDEIGLPYAGITSYFTYNKETGKASYTGVYGSIKPAEMELSIPEVDLIKNFASYISIECPQYIQQAYNATQLAQKEIDPVTYTVTHKESGKTIETTYTLQTAPYYGATSLKTFGVRLMEKPAGGDMITIHVPAGVWIDVFGNTNPEFTIGPAMYTLGYSMDDITGVYTISSTSGYASYGYGPYEDVLKVEASDDEEAGNIMVSGVLADAEVKFYGTFDVDFGTVTVPAGQKIGEVIDYVYDDNDEPVGTYKFGLAGYISDGSSFYSDDLIFTLSAPHAITYEYADYFVGLIEMYEGSPYSFYDLLTIKSISYTPDAEEEEGEETESVTSRRFNPVQSKVLRAL